MCMTKEESTDTSIPFSAQHFEYSNEYLTYIPCRQNATYIGWPTVDSRAPGVQVDSKLESTRSTRTALASRPTLACLLLLTFVQGQIVRMYPKGIYIYASITERVVFQLRFINNIFAAPPKQIKFVHMDMHVNSPLTEAAEGGTGERVEGLVGVSQTDQAPPCATIRGNLVWACRLTTGDSLRCRCRPPTSLEDANRLP
eukprot:6151160-Pyramimonas_sp.AAC.1